MRRLLGGALAAAIVLGACSADPTPTVSPPASATPSETPVLAPSAEPSASASPSAPPTPFPVRESAEADALFADPATCTNPEIGYTVTFPDHWYTNSEIGEQAACSWFTPDFVEVAVPGERPEEIWISIGLVEGTIGYNMLSPTIAGEDVEIDGHEAHWAEFRLLEEIGADSDDLNYHYVIPLARAGPALVATTNVEMADDYELAKAVLDRMMASMELNPAGTAVPTIPDEPTGPPITGDPVTDEDADAWFRLTLEADQDRYRAGQVISVMATLTSLGPADAVVARGSSNPGLIGFSVRVAALDGEWHTKFMSDTSQVMVGPKGRVVIPAGIRRELGIEEGSELVALIEGEAVVLVPRSAIKSRLRSLFSSVPTSMRDELIAERRADAAREASGR